MTTREFVKSNGIGIEMRGFAAARREFLGLIRKRYYGALATATPAGRPEVAPLRYALTDEFELVMGTLRTSRKYTNLQRNPEVAFVVWDDDFSIQIEGRFDEPVGTDQERLAHFFASEFPKEALIRADRPQHVYFRITPTWARYTDLSDDPPRVLTLDLASAGETRSSWPVIQPD